MVSEIFIAEIISIIITALVVGIPLAKKLNTTLSKHKTLIGKIGALIQYFKDNPTTDKELLTLVQDVLSLFPETAALSADITSMINDIPAAAPTPIPASASPPTTTTPVTPNK